MIRSPETPDKGSVVFLLASLANGHSYLREHAFFSKETEREFRKYFAEQGLEIETEMAKEEKWVAETREAVRQGLHLLYPLMQHGALISAGALHKLWHTFLSIRRKRFHSFKKRSLQKRMNIQCEKLGERSGS